MQLRKLSVSALYTSSLEAALICVKEQESARGSFPGPCPVIYNGAGQSSEDIQSAVDGGVSAVVLCASSDSVDSATMTSCTVIHSISGKEDVSRVMDKAGSDSSIFLVDSAASDLDGILEAIPQGSVVIARVTAMQDKNAELEVKSLQSKGVHSVLVENAIVCDNEDLEYASFIMNGLTKKKSSTFNMSGESVQ
jgi:hypothetical protein